MSSTDQEQFQRKLLRAYNSKSPSKEPKDTRVRFGVLGCANIAKKNIRSIALAENAKLVAVASRSLAKCNEFCDSLGGLTQGARRYGSYHELLADPEVEAVYLPLPTTLHVEWVGKCAAAKKHVLVEKPAAINTPDLLGMLQACTASGVLFMDGVMFMHHERLQKIMKVLHDPSGSFGAVDKVTSAFSFKMPASMLNHGDIRTQASGDPLGCIGDLGWYCVRIAMCAFNFQWPTHCKATATRMSAEGVPLDVTCEVYWGAEKQRLLHFHASFCHVFRQWVEVTGENKVLRLDDFTIAKNSSEVEFSTEHFAPSGPLIDTDTLTMSSKEVTKTFGCCQEQRMIENFSTLVRKDPLRGMPATWSTPRFWTEATVMTQAIMDGLMTSIRADGALQAVTNPEF